MEGKPRVLLWLACMAWLRGGKKKYETTPRCCYYCFILFCFLPDHTPTIGICCLLLLLAFLIVRLLISRTHAAPGCCPPSVSPSVAALGLSVQKNRSPLPPRPLLLLLLRVPPYPLSSSHRRISTHNQPTNQPTNPTTHIFPYNYYRINPIIIYTLPRGAQTRPPPPPTRGGRPGAGRACRGACGSPLPSASPIASLFRVVV